MLRSPSSKINEETRPRLLEKLQLSPITILIKSLNNIFTNCTVIGEIILWSLRKINGGTKYPWLEIYIFNCNIV